ncbi:F-type H+-transporting ATPase subunit b [Parvibaculum indicum]|uniref:F0F1 ATP synthase subunit B n=1 Tax=Parvibaculum indicum TaxID=562969 RepID=UPI001424A104|nr:F0F1 ATP synthase subunit B [Parvibaculum indicum]NIJ41740.1 F-type H+-transporting ATPase subunit b [Parvibaculum indicum]
MLLTGEFWVLLGLIVFIGIVIYMRVPGMLTKSLDERGAGIAKELDEARRLREEAQQVLASYQRKQREAMKEAEDIVAQAKVEAEAMAKETRDNLKAQVERRTQMAEQKIAQAEVQAMNEVRAVAADVAIEAARRLIAEKVDTSRDAEIIEKSIADLTAKLH